MPPKLYMVRHAQGEHNATRNFTIRDPPLTAKGKGQCRELSESFEFHDKIGLVVASPLQRTIETASLSFGQILARDDVPFIAMPSAQEVGDMDSDRGVELPELKKKLSTVFADEDLKFDVLKKLDLSQVEEGWTSKRGYYAYTHNAISKRASDLRSWLFQRPEENVIVVTHGAFLHFLTEDWDVEDPMTGTAYNNCEVRTFTFTSASTAKEAHVEETAESKKTRGANEKEHDPHVLEELKTVAESPQ